MTVTVFAVAWLEQADWPRWQKIDSELPPYNRWLSKIEAGIAAAERAGTRTEKILVDPDLFSAWCKVHGRPIHRNSRALYATVQYARRARAM